MSEKYFSLESIKQDVEWLVSSGNQELPLREVLERFEYGAIRPADVRPVVRGRWIEKYGNKLGEDKNYHIHAWYGVIGYTCSICGRFEKEKEPFCNCGADMRAENEEMKNEDN